MKTILFFTLLSFFLLLPNVHSGQISDVDDDNIISLIRNFLTTDSGDNAKALDQEPVIKKHAPPGITFAAPFANVFASDECQCELVLTVEDTLLNPGSLNGQVILRSWTAIDQSGNMTIVTQTFTLMNETSPYFLISQH